ncbi:NUDIX hydrolase [Falsirhodobacter halotolerans]|uniref:NUDIX hydrolase n=1 Tax=Falsirhodobacter halotolerans TaxID=1146892 RepID=UPI001FD1D0DD|nr:NUDIX hydrolase [Falsirhodobacter halotolerans]MCJ8139055.1 NUDIX hydrolase [Falsirhodobacter halotolerans]
MPEVTDNRLPPPTLSARRQVCALCWRRKGNEVQVLLITSRETGRWVMPKGWPVKGQVDANSAAQEAWEEAGVSGTVGAVIGHYAYDKVVGRGSPRERHLPCEVDVYDLRVDALAKRYPEAKQRRRKWFAVSEAARRVDEHALRALLGHFSPMT